MKERPASKRPKMPTSQRAKQFAPFDALSGLSEILKQAEEEHSRDMAARSMRYDGTNSIQKSMEERDIWTKAEDMP